MITRFDQDMDGTMEPEDRGRWVRYDDHMQALAEKDREIANLQTCQCEGCDESLEGEAYCQSCWMKLRAAHHTLMGQAVRFAQYAIFVDDVASHTYKEAKDFLASPEVQAWREQEGL